jgi:formylglycine-generating enzyme required for sulfatase activity
MEKLIKKCLPTYEVLGKIGEGVYGSVFHVKDSLKERAVKVVPIMVERSLSYRSEQDLDSKISHDFYAVQEYYGKIKGDGVIEIHDFHLMDKQVSKHEAKAWLVILMEYCPENLSDHVIDHYPLPPEHAKNRMRELAEILNRLSNRAKDAFIVKDLKPSNLLINKNDQMLIGDLGGLQRLQSISRATSAQFTPNWSAPELIINSAPAGIPSLMYAYGLVCYFIWFGRLPYDKDDFTERTRRIRDNGLPFTRGDMPYYIQGMIEKCLNFDPAGRPKDLDEVLKILSGDKRLIIDDPALSARARESENGTGGKSGNASGATMPRKKIKRPEKPVTQDMDLEPPKTDRNPLSDMHQIFDTWTEPLTGMTFMWVPAGSFAMGSGAWDGEGNKDEFPVHTVAVDGFWMAKYPVTQGDWKKIMAGAFWKKVNPFAANPSCFKTSPDHPVENISWNDVHEFIQKLISLNKNKYLFRLPTEAEWEYAARSCGKPEKFAGSAPLNDLAWYSANSGMTTRPVGMKKPNALGLYDLSGNVYEWCEDNYSESAYKKHREKNPLINEEGPKRVIRGGSWCNSPHEMRCAYRAGVSQDFKSNYLGFRLVMTSVNRKMV